MQVQTCASVLHNSHLAVPERIFLPRFRLIKFKNAVSCSVYAGIKLTFRKHKLFQGVSQFGPGMWHTGWAFLRALRGDLRLESVQKPLLRSGEAHESEDHAGIFVGGSGNGVWSGGAVKQSHPALPA
jgi:hypothetical protein